MTLQNYEHAAAFIAALTGDVNTPMAWRAISDIKGDGREAKIWFAPLATVWNDLVSYNAARYGIFAIINATDGLGREAQNVTGLRANWVDLDKPSALDDLQRALAWSVAPHMVVRSSTGKAHVYWLENEWNDPAKFSELQRKLISTFNGDVTINDTPRIMRVPGFLHAKSVAGGPLGPQVLVTVEAGPAWGKDRVPHELLASSLAGVVVEAGGGTATNALGDPKLAAPTFEWAVKALEAIDPSGLEYDEWRDVTFAFKQAIWSHTNEFVAKTVWDAWNRKSVKFEANESEKLWRSAKAPRMGWPGLLKRSGMKAQMMFGPPVAGGPVAPVGLPLPGEGPQAPVVVGDQLGDMLLPAEQAIYFKGCVLIEKDGRILTPGGRFMDVGRFNAKYGGKQFILTADGSKSTDEPWKAATRGQGFSVPKVDHVRFLPIEASGAIIEDELGRKGINTYVPPVIKMKDGDPSPFVEHLRKILPTERDVLILLNYFACIVQRPGVKIPWAPVIQSVEGVGKNVIKFCMTHAIGRVYTYYPKATELAESGGKFNAWMRGRLFILCDEVRTDEKRNLIEALKDMISEETIQIQGKGVDQDIEDNFGNWCFFTNWQDAVPVDRKSRRWAIFFSKLQNEQDLLNVGMDSAYFSGLYNWVRGEGREIVAQYLHNYLIDPEFDPAIHQRAPITSSTAEAIAVSRTAPELAIMEAIETNQPGFRAGWVSSAAVGMVLDAAKIKASHPTITRIIEGMGYKKIGRAGGRYLQEDMKQPNLYNLDASKVVGGYAADQGYAT